MPKLPWLKFFPTAWLDDDVTSCSLAAQGLWLRMMIVAHGSKQYGYLSQQGKPIPPESLSTRCGCASVDEYLNLLSELDRAGVPSRTPTGIIYSRRMVKDSKARSAAQRSGKLGAMLKLQKNIPSRVPLRPPSRVPLTSSLSDKHVDTVNSLPEELDTQEFRAAWDNWIQHRVEIRHPLKPTGQAALLRKLAEWGSYRAVAAIEYSIANGWQGIFEERLKPGQQRRTAPVDMAAMTTLREHERRTKQDAERVTEAQQFVKDQGNENGVPI